MSHRGQTSPHQRAEYLKNEGNTLHQQGKFQAAYRKYSEAIKEDPQNAIYYANRAACSLALKEYLDAAHDAKKATDLDPKYAKAWARLAMIRHALGSWSKSVDAWKEALTCLPSESEGNSLTETDKRLQFQFTEGLAKAEQALADSEQPMGTTFMKTDEMPWQRAEAVVDQFKAEQKISSAFVILYAYKEFKVGVEAMKELELKPTPLGKKAWMGRTDVLVCLSNGLMRDMRVFHADIPDWFERYNNQAMFECEVFKGWSGGAKWVIEDAPKRLKREGWTSTRRALSMTVRGWLLQGIFAFGAQKPIVSVEFLSRVVDVLDWGGRIWQSVSRDDRGCIFDWSFIRGVKRLQIQAIHSALHSRQDCPYTKEELAELCRNLIAETDVHLPPPGAPIDAGFFLSFWIYPKAEALAILGWYHQQLGFESEDFSSASLEFEQSAKYYLEAAAILPKDDEKALYFLRVAVESHCFNNQPMTVFMPLVVEIEEYLPKMIQLWEHIPGYETRNSYLEQALSFGLLCSQAVKDGRCSVDDVVKPLVMKSVDKWPIPNVKYL